MIQVVPQQLYKLEHLGPVCRILQTGFLKTRPNSREKLAGDLAEVGKKSNTDNDFPPLYAGKK